MLFAIKLVIIISTFFIISQILMLYREQKSSYGKMNSKILTALSGFIANFADTIGLGSFAILVATNKNERLCDEKKLPGTLNSQAMLPVMVQSLFFLKFVAMDFTTLISLISATAIGGLIGGSIVVKLNKQTIRKIMSIGFLLMGILILCQQLHLFPIGGDAVTLRSYKLGMAIVAMILVGMLPAVGIGTYAPSQLVLFFLGMSPLIAFPIMTTASAFVHLTAGYTFIKQKQVAVRETILLSIPGALGVLVAAPILMYVNAGLIHWLLLAVVLYNSAFIWLSYKKTQKSQGISK